MSPSLFRWFLGCVVAGVAAAYALRVDTASRPVHAAANAPAGWEYQTASVDLSALTTTLGELGKAGWEVINIISIDTMVDQTPDGKTHILTQRVEVTSRKAR